MNIDMFATAVEINIKKCSATVYIFFVSIVVNSITISMVDLLIIFFIGLRS